MLLELFIEIGNEIDIAYLGSARTAEPGVIIPFLTSEIVDRDHRIHTIS